MWQIIYLSFLWTLPLFTPISLLKPAVNPHSLAKNWCELLVGCCWRTFVKRAFESLLLWDLVSEVSPALEKQTILQMLQFQVLKCQELRSSPVSEVLVVKRECSILRAVCFKRFSAFVDHFLPCWSIYYHLFRVSNVHFDLWGCFWRHPLYVS